MKLREVINGLDILDGPADTTGNVASVCYGADQCGPDALFVAIPGSVHDGHDFIGKAVERGARYVVHSRSIQTPPSVSAIRVADSRLALSEISKNYFRHPSTEITLIGITGTSGKTTVTYLLEAILSAAGHRCGVIGTVNYRFAGKILPAPNTTPESYEIQRILRLMADAGVSHVVTEVSSHALDLKRVDACEFDVGVFTNLSSEHLDYHLDMETYYQAKKRLFSELLSSSSKPVTRKNVINTDDAWGRRLRDDIPKPAITYGTSLDADVRVVDHRLTLDGIEARIEAMGRTLKIQSSLIGGFNLSNILASVAVACALGIDMAAVSAGIQALPGVPGRMEKVDNDTGIHVFVDYAHKPDALVSVLNTLSELKQNRILTVFGCGGNRDRIKRPVMGETATRLSDLTIITSDNPRMEDPLGIIAEIEAGIDQIKIEKRASDDLEDMSDRHAYEVIPDRAEAIDRVIRLARPGDIVLIAGKGHEDYQIMGDVRTPFDDRQMASRALGRRRGHDA